MNDINKLLKNLTGAQTRVLEEIALCVAPSVVNMIKIVEIGENSGCLFREVKETIKKLEMVEVIEYESFGSKGTSIKVIDLETFEKIRRHFGM